MRRPGVGCFSARSALVAAFVTNIVAAGGLSGQTCRKLGAARRAKRSSRRSSQPSQEIAPDYQPWVLITSEGKTYTGLRLPKPGDDGTEDYADATGKMFTLPSAAIEDRHVASTSIMPDNLAIDAVD